MKNIIKNSLFSILVFYMLFTFTFKSINTISRILLYGLPLIYLCYKWEFVINNILLKNKNTIFFFGILILILVSSLLIPILYRTYDFSYFKQTTLTMGLYLIKILFIYTLFIDTYRERATLDKFIDFFCLACGLYISFTFVCIWFPGFREIWVEAVHMSSIDYNFLTSNRVLTDYVTRVGIDGFGGFRHTFMMSLGVIYSVYRIIISNEESKIKLKFVVFLIICIIGTMMYGRIGSFVSYGSICILLGYFILKKDKVNTLVVIILLVTAITAIFFIGKYTEKGNHWFNWNFDYLNINLEYSNLTSYSLDIEKSNSLPVAATNKVSKVHLTNEIPLNTNVKLVNLELNDSFEILFDSFFVPDFKTILIGDGYFTNPADGSYYQKIDSGLMRNLLFFGLPLTLLFYYSFFRLINPLVKFSISKKNYSLIVLVMLLFIVFAVFEFKGGIFVPFATANLPIVLLIYEENKDLVLHRISKKQDTA